MKIVSMKSGDTIRNFVPTRTGPQLSGIFLALPYALTLLLLAAGAGRIRAPAADGVPYDPKRRS